MKGETRGALGRWQLPQLDQSKFHFGFLGAGRIFEDLSSVGGRITGCDTATGTALPVLGLFGHHSARGHGGEGWYLLSSRAWNC